MHRKLICNTVIVSIVAVSTGLCAQPRPWKSADGSQSVMGVFVKRDDKGVTIRRASNGVEFTIPSSKLHPDDLKWLNSSHPLPATQNEVPNAVFDNLVFGDTRDEVTKKLKTSRLIEMTVEETFLGRTGLNGIFRTRKPLGGLLFNLDFGWAEDGGLKEITLQSEGFQAEQASQKLQPCLEASVLLLKELYGKPQMETPGFTIHGIQDGGMNGTHLWQLLPQGSIILGPSRQADLYQIAIRFTMEQPKIINVSPY